MRWPSSYFSREQKTQSSEKQQPEGENAVATEAPSPIVVASSPVAVKAVKEEIKDLPAVAAKESGNGEPCEQSSPTATSVSSADSKEPSSETTTAIAVDTTPHLETTEQDSKPKAVQKEDTESVVVSAGSSNKSEVEEEVTKNVVKSGAPVVWVFSSDLWLEYIVMTKHTHTLLNVTKFLLSSAFLVLRKWQVTQ